MINRLVLACDLTMLFLAAFLASFLSVDATVGQMLVLTAAAALVFVQILSIGGAYRVEHYRRPLRQVGHVLIGFLPAAVVGGLIFHIMVPKVPLQPSGIWGWAVVGLAALLFGRLVLVFFGVGLVHRHSLLRRTVVLVGDPARARAFVDRCNEEGEERDLLTFLGIFDEERCETAGAGGAGHDDTIYPPMRGDLRDLLEFAKHEQVDVVAIVEPWSDPSKITHWASQMYRIAADVVVDLDPNRFTLNFARVVSLAGQPALQVQQRPLKGSLGLLKALEDYVVAVVGIILAAPILLIAAIAIKLDSPGPVMFHQPRVGFNNKVFNVYKLRTMRIDPHDDGSEGTLKEDPRITRVGAILRRLSIDELPQLFNVLRGEMSIVGPRPHVPNMRVASDLRYETVDRYVERHRVKPGITGWAQLNGMRGGIRTVEKAERGVELDLYYIENWSVWFDIRIMLLTITRGMAGPSVF
ncbi:exopolysaccharide biosynthesis polyprenyl glycosylphosphotransferase [Azorhizobium doebereinerae]|uniref:exopolysaccharide biosynthesis polyprenyl glycosylphosphotransferase n=1 Tax=Azorhizobium doebereinerae TaxID=281091 RepID=UPI0004052AE6|nr:exopolysaccharide biosynthesis polyprenyl glycosylphosphotransferase [Azorhizobium doebereinerae]